MKKSSKKFSFMVGVSGSEPKPLSPLKPDAQSIQANNDVKGKVDSKPFKPNQSGE